MNNTISDVIGGVGNLRGSTVASQSVASRTFDSLRRRIISLDLPPDTVLSRSDLAKQYDVSQTPLRDALLRLESEELVKIFPQSRTVVTKIDADQIYEAHFLRIAVETEVLRRLAVDCDPGTIKRMKTILTMQEALADNPDELPTFQELDETFHQTAMAGVGRQGLHTLLRARSGHLNRVRRLDMPSKGKIERIIEGHHEIINSLEAADPEAAVAAIREHLSQTVSRVDILRDEYPDFFAS